MNSPTITVSMSLEDWEKQKQEIRDYAHNEGFWEAVDHLDPDYSFSFEKEIKYKGHIFEHKKMKFDKIRVYASLGQEVSKNAK